MLNDARGRCSASCSDLNTSSERPTRLRRGATRDRVLLEGDGRESAAVGDVDAEVCAFGFLALSPEEAPGPGVDKDALGPGAVLVQVAALEADCALGSLREG